MRRGECAGNESELGRCRQVTSRSGTCSGGPCVCANTLGRKMKAAM